MEKIIIKTPYIKLDQSLKFSGAVSDGSDARFLITEGYVKVNDELEIRRGRKLYPGDKVEIDYDNQKFIFSVCD